MVLSTSLWGEASCFSMALLSPRTLTDLQSASRSETSHTASPRREREKKTDMKQKVHKPQENCKVKRLSFKKWYYQEKTKCIQHSDICYLSRQKASELSMSIKSQSVQTNRAVETSQQHSVFIPSSVKNVWTQRIQSHTSPPCGGIRGGEQGHLRKLTAAASPP